MRAQVFYVAIGKFVFKLPQNTVYLFFIHRTPEAQRAECATQQEMDALKIGQGSLAAFSHS